MNTLEKTAGTVSATAAVVGALTSSGATQTPMTARDRKLFLSKENILEHHFSTFKQAGEALLAIRDQRLYRENHVSFDIYCRARWDMSKTQANRLISAAQVVGSLTSPETEQIVSRLTEGSVRPLTTLKPETQKRVVERLAASHPAGKDITAKLVQQTAREIAPKEVPKGKKKDGEGGRAGSDLIRRSEFLEELAGWEKLHKSNGTFAQLTPQAVLQQVRRIIGEL